MATSAPSLRTRQKNVERLIARCEDILAGKTQFSGQEWKLARYVSALDGQISELEKLPGVDQDLLRSFQQRAAVLHGVLRIEDESQPQMNGPALSSLPGTPLHPSPLPTLTRQLSHSRGNELLQRASAKKEHSAREELFAKTSDENSSSGDPGLDSVLQRHHQMQDEIANDMVAMAHSLRHNALVAKDIIVKDNKVLDKTNKVAESNIEGVDRETDRLKERNRGCSWGTWLMLIIVFIVFIAMVMFIRIVPKPSPAVT